MALMTLLKQFVRLPSLATDGFPRAISFTIPARYALYHRFILYLPLLEQPVLFVFAFDEYIHTKYIKRGFNPNLREFFSS